MKPLSSNSRPALLAFIREWVDLVSKGHVAEAYEQLFIPSNLSKLVDPQFITRSINNYSVQYRKARPADRESKRVIVSSPFTMDLTEEEVCFSPDENAPSETGISTVEYSLPLEGQWSDLVATFKVIPLPNGEFGMYCSDISVP